MKIYQLFLIKVIRNENYLISLGFLVALTWCPILSANGYVLNNRDLSFEFNYLSLVVDIGPDSVGSFNGIIKNTTSDTISIAVVRRVNALPEGWTSSICLNGLCYNELLDSVATELNAGDSTICGLLIWTNGVGVGMIQLDLFDLNNAITNTSVNNTQSLGQVLYTDYIHVFQISGMILLVAMIGAIVLTFRKREGVKTQSYLKQISRERSEGVEVLDVETNKGVKIDD